MKKREILGGIMSVVLGLSMCFSVCVEGRNTTCYANTDIAEIAKGDVWQDGKITLADANAALKEALGIKKLEEVQFWAADLTSDGEVGLKEVTMILREALGIEKIEDALMSDMEYVVEKYVSVDLKIENEKKYYEIGETLQYTASITNNSKVAIPINLMYTQEKKSECIEFFQMYEGGNVTVWNYPCNYKENQDLHLLMPGETIEKSGSTYIGEEIAVPDSVSISAELGGVTSATGSGIVDGEVLTLENRCINLRFMYVDKQNDEEEPYKVKVLDKKFPFVVNRGAVQTGAPTATEQPIVTEKPVETKAPIITELPIVTEKPVETKAPIITELPIITASPIETDIPIATEGAIKAAVANDLEFSARTIGGPFCAGELFNVAISVTNHGDVAIPFRVGTGSYGESGCMQIKIVDENGKQCGFDITHELITDDMYFSFVTPKEVIEAERLMYLNQPLEEGKQYYIRISFLYDLGVGMSVKHETRDVLIPVEFDAVTTIGKVMEESFDVQAEINQSKFVSGATMEVFVGIKNNSAKRIPVCGEFAYEYRRSDMACMSCSLQDESGNVIGEDVSGIELEFWPYEGIIEPGEFIDERRTIDISKIKEPGTYYLNVVLTYGKMFGLKYAPEGQHEVRIPLNLVF